MVIKNILFLILFILPISVFAYEELQPPISPSTKQNCQYISESSNKQAHKDKYDTEPLKTKIKEIISQQKTKSNRDQDQSWYNTFFDHPTEWLLVLFNGLLAWFTFHLWRSNIHLWQVSQEQSGHMKSSLAIAQKSAEAAEKAVHATRETANVMRAQDRAYIFVKIELDKSTKSKNDIKKMQFDGLIGDVTANIKMINHGKTPAIIKVFAISLIFLLWKGL